MQDADDLDLSGQGVVENDDLLEFRNRNEPGPFELGVFVANKCSAPGEARETLKPRITLLDESVSDSFARLIIVILSQVELVVARGGTKNDRQQLGLLFLAPRFKVTQKAFAVLGVQRHRVAAFKAFEQ